MAGTILGVVAWAGRASNPGPSGFPLDDAWIHLVYGRGLLTNGFLAYQDGVPSTGATSPVWAALLALAHGLAGDRAGHVVVAVQVLGALIHLGAVLVAGDLARRLSGCAAAGAVAAGLVALATPLAAAALSGMEVALAGLLLLLGVRSAAVGSWGRAGVWMALAGGTRPEAGGAVLVLTTVAALGGRPGAGRAVLRFLAAPVAAGAAFVAYDLWASGVPLPSAFYAKGAGSLTALPARVVRAVVGVLPQVPPFAAGLGWLALAGFLPRGNPRRAVARPSDGSWTPGAAGALPGLTAAAFLVANLALIDPIDPAAFYHVRYLLPAVPLLLVTLALGAHRLQARLRGGARAVPLVALSVLAAIGAARTALPVSRHLHNDVRNINEVQRTIGEWLARTLPEGTRIATSDAGAIRYFSRLPALDVTGLNTPPMRAPSEAFLAANPVCAVVLLPAWYRSPDADRLEEAFRVATDDYTVTSNPRMALQVVLRLRREPDETPSGAGVGAASGAEDAAAPIRIRFAGFHSFALDMVPWPARVEGG